MNVLIDVPITSLFAPSAADLDNENERRYLVAQDSDVLAIMVIRAAANLACYEELERFTGKVFDCNSGEHHNGEIGWCQPRNEGIVHSKLTLRTLILDNSAYDKKLSEWVAEAYRRRDKERAIALTGVEAHLLLPRDLIANLRRVSILRGETLNALINEVLLDFAQNNQV